MDKELQEFWEWCGFSIRADGWLIAPDLNNLFKYAVPKFFEEFGETALGKLLDWWIESILWGITSYNYEDAALALYQAIHQKRRQSMNIEEVKRILLLYGVSIHFSKPLSIEKCAHPICQLFPQPITDEALEKELAEIILEVRQYLYNTEFAPEPFTKPVDLNKLKVEFPKRILNLLRQREDTEQIDAMREEKELREKLLYSDF